MNSRTLKEEYARDSFENLLFAIALFRQVLGRWPSAISVVGWTFKAERYDLHRSALKWPKARFTYIGVNNPNGAALEAAHCAEKARLDAAKNDLYLVGSDWAAQRERRDPFHRRHPYHDVDPLLAAFFDFAGTDKFKAQFPWEDA